MVNTISKKSLFILCCITIIFSFLLSSCVAGAIDMDLTVYARERSKIKSSMLIPYTSMELIGGVESFESDLTETMQQQIDLGEKWSWKKSISEDKSTYIYEFESPIIKINSGEFFDWEEVTYDNRKAYRIEFSDYSDFSSILTNFNLTLHAGKILDSNGSEVDSDTVTWINPRNTPYAIVIPKGSIQWVPIVGIGVLSLLFGAILVFLLASGKLKKWGEITLSSSKWQYHATKLGGERKKIEQEKENLIKSLGNQAWAARVYHSDYDEHYSQLKDLDAQSKELNDKLATIESQLGVIREERNKIDKEYTTQLNGVQAEVKEVNNQHSQARTKISTIDKQITKLAQDQTKMHSEIESFKTKLSEVEFSDSPDKDTQMKSFENAISAVEKSITIRATESETLQNEKIELESSLEPIQKQIDQLNQRIDQIKDEKNSDLSPLDQNISELSTEVKNLKNEISEIKQKMSPLIINFGSLVNNARPESEKLSSTYQQIDRIDSQLTTIALEHDLLKTRLETADKSAIRNFIIAIVALLSLAVAIIALITFFLSN